MIAVVTFKLLQALAIRYREYKYSKVVERVLDVDKCLVTRGDSKEEIPVWDLAVGDVIEL